ncbi:hypothetical protein BHE74_00018682 [Ensete ventricosum]|nr:hypothetical protein BHE74_00018682 [Ensete ventricosum]
MVFRGSQFSLPVEIKEAGGDHSIPNQKSGHQRLHIGAVVGHFKPDWRSPKDGGAPLFLHGLPPHPRCFQDDNSFPLILLERFHLLATPRRRTLPGAPFSFPVIDQDYEPSDGSDDGIYLLVSSGPGVRVGIRWVSWRCVCRRVLAVGSGAAEERQGRHQGAPQDDILPSYSGAIRRLMNIIYPDALSFTSSLW